jgi:hypothetical protein
MAKSTSSKQVTLHAPENVEQPATESLAAPDVTQPVSEPKTRPGFWVALVVWTAVFIFLMAYMLVDLVLGLFRK